MQETAVGILIKNVTLQSWILMNGEKLRKFLKRGYNEAVVDPDPLVLGHPDPSIYQAKK